MRLLPGIFLISLAGCGSLTPSKSPDLEVPRNHDFPIVTVEALKKLRVGMTADEVKAALAPVAVGFGRNHGGGTGSYSARWKLNDKHDVHVAYGGHYEPEGLRGRATSFQVEEVTRENWYGLFWDPEEGDMKRAFDIASEELRVRRGRGEIVSDAFPTGGAGYEVRDPIGEVDLGRDIRLRATIGSARWLGPRIIEVNFFNQGHWFCEVAVNLDSGKVVPKQWKPAVNDIAAARKIADGSIQTFLQENKDCKLEVEAWGEFEYVHGRRLIVLCYTRYVNGAGHLVFRTVNFDEGSLFVP